MAAYKMLDAVSPNKQWESLPFHTRNFLLAAAESLVDNCPYAIPALAAEWRRDPG